MTRRSERLVALALRLLPARHRDLGAALLAEAPAVPPGWPRLRWLLGGLRFLATHSTLRLVQPGPALTATAVALAVVDHVGTSDDASQLTLLLLLAAAAGFGFTAPARAWVAGLALGSAIAVPATSAAVWHHYRPPGTAGGIAAAASLFVLVVPASVSACLGAGAARLRRRSR